MFALGTSKTVIEKLSLYWKQQMWAWNFLLGFKDRFKTRPLNYGIEHNSVFHGAFECWSERKNSDTKLTKKQKKHWPRRNGVLPFGQLGSWALWTRVWRARADEKELGNNLGFFILFILSWKVVCLQTVAIWKKCYFGKYFFKISHCEWTLFVKPVFSTDVEEVGVRGVWRSWDEFYFPKTFQNRKTKIISDTNVWH